MGSDQSCGPQLQLSTVFWAMVWFSCLQALPLHLRRPRRLCRQGCGYPQDLEKESMLNEITGITD